MFALALAVMSLSVPLVGVDPPDLVPGDGLALDPVPPVVVPVNLPTGGGEGPTSPLPFGLGGLAGVAVLGGGVAVARRRRNRSTDPVFVVVHGNGGEPSDFDILLTELGATPADVVAFDWRSVEAGETSSDASKTASTERAAAELDRLIRDLSVDHSNIYSLHHSKGGAAGVAMIAALDDGTRPPIDGYRGAALLDPAISSGAIGAMQRFGGWSQFIPDNGGFDPVACTDDGCRDTRDHLGEASGVEVIAIRNPDAVLTNFWDRPEGMRVYDLVDDGGISAAIFASVPPLAVLRTFQAHSSVLDHWAVVDCLKAEVAQSGSCTWKGHDRTRSWWTR